MTRIILETKLTLDTDAWDEIADWIERKLADHYPSSNFKSRIEWD